MRKIFDWVFIVFTFALTLASLGVVGSFELGNIDFVGFFMGQAVCIAGIALLAVVHHLLSKKRKSPRAWGLNAMQAYRIALLPSLL